MSLRFRVSLSDYQTTIAKRSILDSNRPALSATRVTVHGTAFMTLRHHFSAPTFRGKTDTVQTAEYAPVLLSTLQMHTT